MANTLRIKRSVSTNTPSSLAQGELAYSEDDSPNGEGELFIGTAGATVTKIATSVYTGTDGISAQPNASAQDNQTLTTGLGIDGADAGSTGNITFSLATVELTNVLPVGADQFVFNDDTDSLPKKYAASTIPLSIFNNDSGWIAGESDTLALVTGRGATTATACTFSGGILMADSDLNRPVIEDYGVKHTAPTVSANAVTVDCVNGNSFAIDMEPATAAVVLTLSNPPASGTYGEVTLHIIMGAPAYDITWPGAVTWFAGGNAPTLTSVQNGVDTVHLYTIDGGTNWYGTYANRDAAIGGGTVTAVTGGNGIDSSGGDTPDISLNLSELSVTTMAGADWIAFDDAGTSNKALVSGINVGIFSNATAEYVSENDTLVVANWNWVLDEDLMGSNSAIHLATQQSIKAYVDTAVTGALTHKGGYNAATNTPALDTGSPVLEIGDMYTVTVAGSFFGTVALEIGDVLISDVDSVDAAQLSDWTIVQSNITYASETVPGYIEIATQAEVDAASSALLCVVPSYLHNTTFDGGTF